MVSARSGKVSVVYYDSDREQAWHNEMEGHTRGKSCCELKSDFSGTNTMVFVHRGSAVDRSDEGQGAIGVETEASSR